MFEIIYQILEKGKGLFLLSLLLLGMPVLGQMTITGTVTDVQENIALPGVNIISSMQMGRSSTNELSDDAENWTTAHIKKLNQSVDYKINDPDITIKKNENNQI